METTKTATITESLVKLHVCQLAYVVVECPYSQGDCLPPLMDSDRLLAPFLGFYRIEA